MLLLFQGTTSPKGQVEIILQICDIDANYVKTTADTSLANTPNKRSSISGASSAATSNESKSRWSLKDMRRTLSVSKRDKPYGLCLKITTSKMRCSIKVKEEFENVNFPIYVKTTVFERDILSSSWRSDQFAPSLSIRWDVEKSTLIVPLYDLDDLKWISIKVNNSQIFIKQYKRIYIVFALQTTVAVKTKIGKKIVLGTLFLGENTSNQRLEHWNNTISSNGAPVGVWHAFE